jgi:RNA polymerase sigma-70 factor (ECF subfamily)
VERVLANDSRAFDEFYAAFVPSLYRFLYYAVGQNHDEAEDLLQETMLAALRSLHRFQGHSRLITWLRAIAQHKVQDYYRSKQRRDQHLLDVESDEFDSPLALSQFRSEEARFVDVVELQQALQQIPSHYRTVLIGKYIEGFSVNELAEIMSRSQKSVESLLTRARLALRKTLLHMRDVS